MDIFFIGILILVLAGILQLFVKNQNWKLNIISVSSVLSAILVVYNSIKIFFDGGYVRYFNFSSVFNQNLAFALDNISAFFAIIISVMSTLAIIYSKGYLKPYIEKGKGISAHCLFLMLLTASMLGVVSCQNALMFLIIWEIMSLSSFFLVIFEHEKK